MPATPRRWREAVSAGFVGRQNSALNPSSRNTWVRVGAGAEGGGHQFFAEEEATQDAQLSLPWSPRRVWAPRRPWNTQSKDSFTISSASGDGVQFHSQEYLPAPEPPTL